MDKIDAYKSLNEVFRDIFDDDGISVNEKTTADDIDGWDSLAHVSLLVSIEKAFSIKFSMDDVVNFKSVGDIYEAIERGQK